MLSFFPRDVWGLIESDSEGVPTYSCRNIPKISAPIKYQFFAPENFLPSLLIILFKNKIIGILKQT